MKDEALAKFDAHARAFPLLCPVAFDDARLELDEELRERLVAELAKVSRGRSEEAAEHLVHRAWGTRRRTRDHLGPSTFADTNRAGVVTLEAHAMRWADEFLEATGDGYSLRYARGSGSGGPRTHCAAVLRWRWTSLVVPKALVVGAARYRAHEARVVLATPTLQRSLREEPWAELHLHAGAAIDFDSWWIEQLLTGRRTRRDVERRHLADAALLRWLLHLLLWRGMPPEQVCRELGVGGQVEESRVLADWLSVAAEPTAQAILDRPDLATIAETFGYSARGSAAAAWRAAESPDIRALAAEATDCTNAAGDSEPYLDEVEIVRRFLDRDAASGAPLPRSELVRHLFWRYQRLRAWFFTRVVEGPGVPGLGRFRRHYEAIGNSTRGVFPRAVGLETGDGTAVRALEVRPAFPAASALGRRLRDLAGAAHAAQVHRASEHRIELGIVLSLIKPSDHDEGRPRAGEVRFARYIQQQASRTESLADRFDKVPLVLALLRGVDMASHELRAPTWVMAPFLRRVREVSQAAALALGHERGWRISPLRVTAHAGEEANSAVEGLRRIDELLATGTLREGDRIGHGLALGCDVAAHIDRPFLQPRDERIFDLLWELEMIERGSVSTSGSRVEVLRRHVATQVKEIALDVPALADLPDLPRRLLDADADMLMSWVHAPPSHPWTEAFLTREDLWERLSEPVEARYETDDVAAVEALRLAVVREVARLEIVVEVNPTSNLVIGDLATLADHPVFRIAPIVPSSMAPHVGVALCDDDPITFATRLGDEVAYIHSALRHHDRVSAQDAAAWIEGARRSAWMARFTTRESTEPTVLREIEMALGLPSP